MGNPPANILELQLLLVSPAAVGSARKLTPSCCRECFWNTHVQYAGHHHQYRTQ
jgi:hypothetical protein